MGRLSRHSWPIRTTRCWCWRKKAFLARFVVDASGNTSRLHRHIGGRRRYSDFFRNIAVLGYFQGGKRLPAPNEGDIFPVAFDQGWIWCIPLRADLTSVGAENAAAVQNNGEVSEERSRAEQEARYRREYGLFTSSWSPSTTCTVTSSPTSGRPRRSQTTGPPLSRDDARRATGLVPSADGLSWSEPDLSFEVPLPGVQCHTSQSHGSDR